MSPVFSDVGLAVLGVICIGLSVTVLMLSGRLRERQDMADPEEWTAPLRAGSTRTARRLTAHLRDHGRMLPKRTSAAARKAAAATSRKPQQPRRPWVARLLHALTYTPEHGPRGQNGATR